MKKFTILAALLILASCKGEPTIDGSSEQAYEESLARVAKEMDAEQGREFMGAIMTLSMMELDLSQPNSRSDLLRIFDGKTASEIIELAQQRRTMAEANAARRAAERKAEELGELEEKEKMEAQALEALSAISISEPSVDQREGYIGIDTTIRFTVTNGLDQAISRLYWENTVYSPDRAVPWLEEDSNYQISGGLEPGETATWSLNPGGLKWDRVELPEDALLEIKVVRADGADGEPIYDARQLSDYDRSRLKSLREN